MNEFALRWLFVGVGCAGGLAAAGARLGTGSNWILLGIWFGFCNAMLRVLLLRMRWRRSVLWLLLLALGGLNSLLFLTLNFWFPAVIPPTPQPVAAAIASATLWSWMLSSHFRAHDGRWHWITYHGALPKPQ